MSDNITRTSNESNSCEKEIKSRFLERQKQVRESKDNRDIHCNTIYIDMVDDLVIGLVLAKIVYWHEPPQGGTTGDRLKVRKNGRGWIAKDRDEWWVELRISRKQADRALAYLEDNKIIDVAYHRFNNKRIMHIALNWEVFDALHAATVKSRYKNRPETRAEIEARRAAEKAALTADSSAVTETETAESYTMSVSQRETVVSPKGKHYECLPKVNSINTEEPEITNTDPNSENKFSSSVGSDANSQPDAVAATSSPVQGTKQSERPVDRYGQAIDQINFTRDQMAAINQLIVEQKRKRDAERQAKYKEIADNDDDGVWELDVEDIWKLVDEEVPQYSDERWLQCAKFKFAKDNGMIDNLAATTS